MLQLMTLPVESLSALAERKRQFHLVGTSGQDLLVPMDTTVTLGGGTHPALTSRVITTSSVDEYKAWVGRPDELADEHPWAVPANEWTGQRFADRGRLSAAEAEAIEQAGWVYLFHDSSKVASYARAIEDYQGVFDASLYHFRRVIVQPGGRLLITGRPAVVVLEELELQGSGQFETYTPCHVTLGHLRKTGQQEFAQN